MSSQQPPQNYGMQRPPQPNPAMNQQQQQQQQRPMMPPGSPGPGVRPPYPGGPGAPGGPAGPGAPQMPLGMQARPLGVAVNSPNFAGNRMGGAPQGFRPQPGPMSAGSSGPMSPGSGSPAISPQGNFGVAQPRPTGNFRPPPGGPQFGGGGGQQQQDGMMQRPPSAAGGAFPPGSSMPAQQSQQYQQQQPQQQQQQQQQQGPPMQRPGMPPFPQQQQPPPPQGGPSPISPMSSVPNRMPANYIPPMVGTPPPPAPSGAPPGTRAGRRAYPTAATEAYVNTTQVDPFSASSPYGDRPVTPQTPAGNGPQFFAPGMAGRGAVPTFGQPQPGGPQSYPGQQGGPAGAPYAGQQMQQGGQQWGGQQPQQGHPGGQFGQSQSDMGSLTNSFGQMHTGGGSQGVNLLQFAPNVAELDAPPPTWITTQSSVSQHPESNADPKYKRCTMNAIPQTMALMSKCTIPLGLLVTPYRHILAGEDPVPLINPPQIVRCRRCRTYINPWVQFVEQGSRWKCNLCFLTNEVPTFFDWDPDTRAHVDRMTRPELTHAVVEFVAPQEYMVRPPQPVVFLFIIDVSFPAVQSGMLATAARTILDTLDLIPNTDNRTKVGFITVDSALHFYNLSPNVTEPQMLVVSDLDDTFLPMPYDLLVSLTESRSLIEALLQRIADMFKNTQNAGNVLGRAVQAAHKMISAIGGKIIILQASLPNQSEGALKPRENPSLLGTPKEVTLLQPQSGFYKNMAVSCSPTQVSMDVFLFSNQYADVATLSGCAKFTGGSVYYYPGFNAGRSEDALKFAHEFSHFLSRPIGLEAVMRVRASKGIRMTSFHGNFFLRSTDLLALPNVSPDNSYGVEMALTENLTTSLACFQTALLHTSSTGERRIRVITLAVPVTNNLADVFAATDQFALASLLSKKAIERALSSKLEDARDALMYKLDDILGAYKSAFTSSGQSVQLLVPENLKLLPLLILGLLKNATFRATSTIPSDVRSYLMAMLYVLPPELSIAQIHPRFWALHTLEPQAGLPGPDGTIVYPATMNLSSEKLERHGLYLLENGLDMFLWVSRGVSPELIHQLFDKQSYDAIQVGKTTLPALQNDFSVRVNNIIGKVREVRLQMMTTYPHLYVVKEDGEPSIRMQFLSQLIEDRIDASYSYHQFLTVLRERLSKVSAA
ncbi:COPII subunit [Geranomyces variabilis]|nr:COPII subunit [Geranomyces variabilis]